MQQPQEGEVRRNRRTGATATYRGGQWYEEAPAQSAPQGQPGLPGFVPMETPADRRAAQTAERADQRLSLAEESAARAAQNDARRVEMEGQTQGRQAVQSESDLRREFQGLKDVQDYAIVRAAYQNVAATANNASAAGDLSLIFAYMKMLDPTSAVRETEFANAQNAAGVPDQVRNQWNRILTGERLNPNQRQDFVAQAQSLYKNRETRYNQIADWYGGLATRYGYDPAGVVMPQGDAPQIQAPAQPGENGPASAQDGPVGQVTGRVQQYEGAPYEPTFSGPGSTHENPFVLQQVEPNSEADYDQRRALYALPRGAFIARDGQVFRMTAEAYPTEGGAMDPSLGGVTTRETNMGDNARAFGMAAMEQIPFGDEAVQGVAGALSGRGYSDVRDSWQAAANIDNQASRGYRVAGGIGGAALTMAAPGGGMTGRFLAAAPKGMAIARGAMVGGATGAVYGAGADDGGLLERVDGARDGLIAGGLTGGLMTGGGRRIGEMATTAPQTGRAGQVRMLQDHGVSLTPGQRIGGVAKTAEDLAMRVPIFGTAIRGARARGVESMNRAKGNVALDHIGEGVPSSAGVGGEMVGHVHGRLSSEFDRAYSLVPELNVNDETLRAGIARIGLAKADLPPAQRDQFESIMAARLERLQGSTSGERIGSIRGELNNLAGGYLKSTDEPNRLLGRMIAELGDELDGAISRANPEAGAILQNARAGYGEYIQLERASTAANGRPFSSGQLENAVKASDSSVRHGAMGRGTARGQEFANAARSVMPDQFGNPGSADAYAASALAYSGIHAPITTSAIAGGLTAAATPYFMMARRAVDRLPAAASQREVQAVIGELDQLAAKDPNVIVLRDEIMRRAAPASGVAGGNIRNIPPLTMTGGR